MPSTARPSSGRTPVVLYACTTREGNVGLVLDELRRHARCHEWEVVGEYSDMTGASPPEQRTGFLEAKAKLASGAAVGIVTRYPAMAAHLPVEQREFVAWLLENERFAHFTWTNETTEGLAP